MDETSVLVAPPLARIDNALTLVATGFTGINLTAADIGVPGDYAFWQWKDGNIGISAVAVSDANVLAENLTELGMTGAEVYGQIVTGFFPTTAITALASLDSLRFARPALKPITYVGSTTSGGDPAMRSDIVRDFGGLTGEGVRVGIISDSFDNGGAGSAAADISTGDLPGVGNPNNATTPVTILRDNVAGVDEGRAMAQIIHDVAPGAELLFSNLASAAGLQSTQTYADNIRQMREDLDADIIVDDIVFPTEPFFMDGLVAQAINEVVADGAVYFSAAGNHAADSYESSFVSSGVTQNLTLGGVTRSELLHDFNPGSGVDTRQRISLPSGTNNIIFQWDDPFITDAPSSGGAVRDFDIYAYLPDGTLFRGGVSSTIGGDAVEILTVPLIFASDIDIVIGLRNGTNPGGFLKYVIVNEAPTSNIMEYDTASATAFGHVNAVGAIGVGAAYYQETPEFGDDPAILFNSSSLGGINILFDASGNRLAQPESRLGVDIVAPTGGNTTFFGSQDPVGTGQFEADGFRNFFGTSAAAPHAAAIAALLLQADPRLEPGDTEAILEGSAIDMDNPFTVGFDAGADAATGHGFIDALGALGIVWDQPQLGNLEPDDYILVNRTNDALDANAGDGVVDIDLGTAGNQVSLRAAIIAANAGGANARTLLVPAGNYNLTLTGTEGTANAAVHDLDITGDVTIVGAGAGLAVINAGGVAGIDDRVFEVRPLGELDLARVTVTGGTVAASGGGIVVYSANGGAEGTNPATLTLTDVAVVGNTAGAVGAGIYNRGRYGNTTINRSVIANNHANNTSTGNRMAGALYSDRKPLTLSQTIIAGNTANFLFTDGFSDPAIDLVVTNTTNFVSSGQSMLGDVSTNLPALLNASDLYNGTPERIVTSVADTFNNGANLNVLSLRDAIHLANGDATLDEVWLPAWDFLLTR